MSREYSLIEDHKESVTEENKKSFMEESKEFFTTLEENTNCTVNIKDDDLPTCDTTMKKFFRGIQQHKILPFLLNERPIECRRGKGWRKSLHSLSSPCSENQPLLSRRQRRLQSQDKDISTIDALPLFPNKNLQTFSPAVRKSLGLSCRIPMSRLHIKPINKSESSLDCSSNESICEYLENSLVKPASDRVLIRCNQKNPRKFTEIFSER